MSSQIVEDFTTRELDQEPDCIALTPVPGIVIVGTYSLLKSDTIDTSTRRCGSLQLLPHNDAITPTGAVDLGRRDFDFGIYDLHFHPQHERLLGVATSDAKILFFLLHSIYNESNQLKKLELRDLGYILVEEPEDGRAPAIITQFSFITRPDDGRKHDSNMKSAPSIGEAMDIMLVATTQYGNTKLIKVQLSGQALVTLEPHEPMLLTDATICTVHSHQAGFEAWTTTAVLLNDQDCYLILSGGDDSRLIGSIVDVKKAFENEDTNDAPVLPYFNDRRSHEAGVVSLLALGRFGDDQLASKPYLLLTGSYDEHIRLFAISTQSRTLVIERRLGGGVWKMSLLDSYETKEILKSASDKLATSSSSAPSHRTRHWVLLIACHDGGACVLRLTYASFNQHGEATGLVPEAFEIRVEAHFTVGHASMVYACSACPDSMREADVVTTGKTDRGYSVLSSSFYDKKLCNWRWADRHRLRAI